VAARVLERLVALDYAARLDAADGGDVAGREPAYRATARASAP
jgi:hypothetical protein